MQQHEIYHSASRVTSLVFTGGELKIKERNVVSGYGIRSIKDGRIGFGYCQDEGDVKKTIEDATQISRFSVQSKFSFAPKTNVANVDVFDPALDPEDYELLRGYVEEARNAVEPKKGLPRIMASINQDKISLTNSEGFEGNYGKSGFSLYVEAMLGDGFGFAHFASLQKPQPFKAHEIGMEAIEKAQALQAAKKPETNSYTVVFELDALENIIDVIIPSFSGDWKRRAITKLRDNERMFSEQLTIEDDPLAAGGIASRPFDDEGMPSAKKALVENGTVRGFLYDRETAALGNVSQSSAGACTRNGYDSPPALSPSNIVIKPGEWKNFNELGQHIELHSAHGSHTANMTTGDIGLEVSAAFLVEANGDRKPVKGFMISGNVFEMLKDIELESTVQCKGTLISPRIAIRNLKIVT